MNLLNKPKIKICGIKEIDTLDLCIKNNVHYFGLIFYEKSPRNIRYQDAKKILEYSKNKKIYSVGVFVNEKKEVLTDLLNNLNFNFIQLHGSESNLYINFIKNKNKKVKVIKVISISEPEDFLRTKEYPDTDMFLFDYKPLKSELPGGNSKAFDWNLIKNIDTCKPWFLSGGININNVNDIKKFIIPYGIDISSGVEDKVGIKSKNKILEFLDKYGSK